MRLPDFIVGGAPRCATTWLARVLDSHPQVVMAKPFKPEPKFFLVDQEFDKGLSYYANRWFRDIPNDLLAGEKSTNYMESEVTAERIHMTLPRVKMIFCIREPAERALSNYLWSCANGLEHLDFKSALEEESARERGYTDGLIHSRPYSYFSRGLYADHLTRYLERFPRDAILVLRFEDIGRQPRSVVEEVGAFLGLSTGFVDIEAIGVVNGTDESCEQSAKSAYSKAMEWLRIRYREPNDRLASLLGTSYGWNDEGY